MAPAESAPTFSIGTSSSVAKVDMALEDIIKSRRNERRKPPRRSNPKAIVSTAAPRRAVASVKSAARRSVVVAAKRGVPSLTTPARSVVRATSMAARKSGVAPAAVIQAPTSEAITAAARAMRECGFSAPRGMQMQISFVPKKNSSVTTKNVGGRGGINRARGAGRGAGRGGRRAGGGKMR